MSGTGASGHMIVLVREAKGWTQLDLATSADVSQSFISKVERGLLSPDEQVLGRLAAALEVPPALLCDRENLQHLEVTCLHHRRRASRMAVATVRRIESLAQLVSLSKRRLAAGFEEPRTLPLSRQPLHAAITPEDIAAKLRADWGVPPGPIDNLTALLESAGIAIIIRHLGTDAQDAVSMWPLDDHPVVLLNTGLPPDRARFTLAHELGHLLMHEMPDDGQEDQANAFAAEFLTPADMVGPDLDGLTVRQFSRLMSLKVRWKVSMAALIQRAAQLGYISQSQLKSFRIRLNQYGWSRREPGDLPVERPSTVRTLVARRLAAGHTEQHLADLTLMLPSQFRRHYLDFSSSQDVATRTDEAQ